jgi:hypothetical protein
MADNTYTPKVYKDQGGDRLTVAPGGELLIEGAVRGLIKGQAFYVDSAAGSNSYDGTTWTNAVATLDYAVGLCTAGRGDIIFLAPGHAETGTAAAMAALDVAGITVQGVGAGSLKPTLTLGTATTPACATVSARGSTPAAFRMAMISCQRAGPRCRVVGAPARSTSSMPLPLAASHVSSSMATPGSSCV